MPVCGATTTKGKPCQRPVQSGRCEAHKGQKVKGAKAATGCTYKQGESKAAYTARVTAALKSEAAKEVRAGRWILWVVDESVFGEEVHRTQIEADIIYAPGPVSALLASGTLKDMIQDSITEGNDVVKWAKGAAYAKRVVPPMIVYKP